MTFINYASREINCKIVYYGPGLCGKTTNLQYIYEKTNPNAKGKLISLATETDRTLFFDFLPLELGDGPRLQDPLPPLHRPRPGLLRRHPQADPEGRRRRRLRRRLPGRAHGRQRRVDREPAGEPEGPGLRPDDASPTCCSSTSATCPTSSPVDEMTRLLRRKDEPVFEAVAAKGTGVFETLKGVAKLVLQELTKTG